MFLHQCGQFLKVQSLAIFEQQKRDFAARRGKRIKAAMDARKRSAQRRAEAALAPVKKWRPKNMMVDKSALKMAPRRYDPSRLMWPMPPDNVFFADAYPQLGYSLEQIIEMHRETNHPTVLNAPDCLVEVRVEFDLKLKKKTKFVDYFDGLIDFQHRFPVKSERRILAIARTREDQDKAAAAGAVYSGHADLIKAIEKGDLKVDEHFDFLVCHGDALLDLAPVRGLLRRHFPSKQKGNFGKDMAGLVDKFMKGIEFKLVKDDYEQDYGWLELPFARLDMTTSQISDNLTQILTEVDKHKPFGSSVNPDVQFIQRVLITAPPSEEDFRLNHWEILTTTRDPYIDLFKKKMKKASGVQDDDDDLAEAAA